MKRYCFTVLIAGFVALVPLLAIGQPTPKEITNVWAKAEAAIAQYLKSVDPQMRFAEFRSELLCKYLPNFRVFVRFDRHMVRESRLFLVNQEAKVTDLGEGDWRGDPATRCWRVARVAEFLRAQKIRVHSGEDGIEVAKLFEELQGAPNFVAFLRVNTSDFTVFDKRFMERHYDPRADWRYTSAERKGGWTVKVEYVGPPAMVMQPPTYGMDSDEQHSFQDLRRYPYSVR